MHSNESVGQGRQSPRESGHVEKRGEEGGASAKHSVRATAEVMVVVVVEEWGRRAKGVYVCVGYRVPIRYMIELIVVGRGGGGG